MNRDEVIRQIAADTGETIQDCRKWMGIIVDGIGRCIVADDHVTITGLGTFYHKQPGKARPISFGRENTAPSKVKVRYEPSQHLATAVAEGLTVEEAAYRREIVKALKRGEQVPGYRLCYGDKIERVDDTDLLASRE